MKTAKGFIHESLSGSEPGGDHGESDPQVASKGVRGLVVSSSRQQS